MLIPKRYEAIQTHYTSNSRGTRMGRRIIKNVNQLASFLQPPIICVGCGDGFELECLLKHFNISIEENANTKQIVGLEVTKSRVQIGYANNLPVYEGPAENITQFVGEIKYNIYCAHCLEHCFDRDAVIENFKKIALDTIVIVVPIELSGRTRNRAHYAPIPNLGYITNLFGMDWKATTFYRWNIELEGVLILKRDPMNWPERRVDRSSELRVKGQFQ